MSGGILSKLDPDLVIQEAMYGFIMALTLVTTAQLGFIQYSSRTSLILAIVSMDFVWGIIDMYIFYRVDLMARKRRINRFLELRDMDSWDEKVELLQGEFSGTVFEIACDEDKRRMADVFLRGGFCGQESFRKENRHYVLNAVTAFVTNFATVVPSVLCLYFIEDFHTALFGSSLISAVALFFIGYLMSPSNSRSSKVMTGVTTAAVSLLFTIFAAYFGG